MMTSCPRGARAASCSAGPPAAEAPTRVRRPERSRHRLARMPYGGGRPQTVPGRPFVATSTVLAMEVPASGEDLMARPNIPSS